MGVIARITDLAFWPMRRQAKVRHAPILGGTAASTLAGSAQAEPKEIEPLVQAMRRDYQVRLAELVLVSNVKSLPVTFLAGGDDPRTVALRDQIETLWENTITDATDFIAHGRVAFEKIYGYKDGLTVIRKLDALPFSQTEMKLGEAGEYAGLTLKGGTEDMEFGAAKSWWLALDAKPLEPHGRSRFIGAPHAAWSEKCEAIRMRKLCIKKYVLVGGIAYVPQNRPDENGNVRDVTVEVGNRLDQLKAGGYLVVPGTRDKNGNFDYTFQFPTVQDPSPIDAVIDGIDAEILRAFGIPETVVTEGGGVGSYAANDQKMLILYCNVEDICRQLVRSFQSYVIDKLVAMNGTQPISATMQSLTEAKRQQELAQPLANGQKPAIGPGEPTSAPAAGTALQGQSRLQFVRNWKATDDILDRLTAGTISAARATISLKGLGYSHEEAAALIEDATSEVAA